MFIACSSPKENTEHSSIENTPIQSTGIAIAKPVIYEVIIKNFDTADVWKAECLEGLNRAGLLNTIFEEIYSGKLTALEYYSEDTMQIAKVRELEASFDNLRNEIAKIQFTENWFYDTVNQQLNKKVQEITLGYPKYMDDTVIVGYKPVFKINFE